MHQLGSGPKPCRLGLGVRKGSLSLSYAEKIVMKVPRREENRHRPRTTIPLLAKIEVSYGHHTLLVCCMRAGYSSQFVPRGACHPSGPTDLEARRLLFLIWDQ